MIIKFELTTHYKKRKLHVSLLPFSAIGLFHSSFLGQILFSISSTFATSTSSLLSTPGSKDFIINFHKMLSNFTVTLFKLNRIAISVTYTVSPLYMNLRVVNFQRCEKVLYTSCCTAPLYSSRFSTLRVKMPS